MFIIRYRYIYDDSKSRQNILKIFSRRIVFKVFRHYNLISEGGKRDFVPFDRAVFLEWLCRLRNSELLKNICYRTSDGLEYHP